MQKIKQRFSLVHQSNSLQTVESLAYLSSQTPPPPASTSLSPSSLSADDLFRRPEESPSQPTPESSSTPPLSSPEASSSPPLPAKPKIVAIDYKSHIKKRASLGESLFRHLPKMPQYHSTPGRIPSRRASAVSQSARLVPALLTTSKSSRITASNAAAVAAKSTKNHKKNRQSWSFSGDKLHLHLLSMTSAKRAASRRQLQRNFSASKTESSSAQSLHSVEELTAPDVFHDGHIAAVPEAENESWRDLFDECLDDDGTQQQPSHGRNGSGSGSSTHKKAKLSFSLSSRDRSKKSSLSSYSVSDTHSFPAPYPANTFNEFERNILIQQMRTLQESMAQLGKMLTDQDCNLVLEKQKNEKLTEQVNCLADENMALRQQMNIHRRERNSLWQELELQKLSTRQRRDKNMILTNQIQTITQQKDDMSAYSQSLMRDLNEERRKNRQLTNQIRKYSQNVKSLHKKTSSLSGLQSYMNAFPTVSPSPSASPATPASSSSSSLKKPPPVLVSPLNSATQTVSTPIPGGAVCDLSVVSEQSSFEPFDLTQKRADLLELERQTLQVLNQLQEETRELLGRTQAQRTKSSNNSVGTKKSKPTLRKPRQHRNAARATSRLRPRRSQSDALAYQKQKVLQPREPPQQPQPARAKPAAAAAVSKGVIITETETKTKTKTKTTIKGSEITTSKVETKKTKTKTMTHNPEQPQAEHDKEEGNNDNEADEMAKLSTKPSLMNRFSSESIDEEEEQEFFADDAAGLSELTEGQPSETQTAQIENEPDAMIDVAYHDEDQNNNADNLHDDDDDENEDDEDADGDDECAAEVSAAKEQLQILKQADAPLSLLFGAFEELVRAEKGDDDEGDHEMDTELEPEPQPSEHEPATSSACASNVKSDNQPKAASSGNGGGGLSIADQFADFNGFSDSDDDECNDQLQDLWC